MARRSVCLVLLAALVAGVAMTAACALPVTEKPPVASVTPLAPAALPETDIVESTGAPVTFAIIGDYGVDDVHGQAVAKLVASWKPDFVLSVGDGYYARAGGTGTAKYDESTGSDYCAWLKDITTSGNRSPVGKANANAFFPVLGNHDYGDASLRDYLTYFDLPGAGFRNSSGNERFYDFVQGPVHFFALNSNAQEPSGTTSTSAQARWVQSQLAASKSPWNIAYMHHPPYSSDVNHGSTTRMQWPFKAWGADAVVAGHAHTYERVMHDGVPYFVNGLGGATRYKVSTPVPGSALRYQADWGAQKVTATDTSLIFEFYDVSGKLVDRYRVSKEPASPDATP